MIPRILDTRFPGVALSRLYSVKLNGVEIAHRLKAVNRDTGVLEFNVKATDVRAKRDYWDVWFSACDTREIEVKAA